MDASLDPVFVYFMVEVVFSLSVASFEKHY